MRAALLSMSDHKPAPQEPRYFPHTSCTSGLISYLSTVLLQAAVGTELSAETLPVERRRAIIQTGKGIHRHVASY
jgi:hypothetical protein